MWKLSFRKSSDDKSTAPESLAAEERHRQKQSFTDINNIHFNSDVNKDLTFKAKDKDQTLKAKDQDKDQTYKDKDKDQTFKTKEQDKD